jgi:soluble lytic murein transglycosylase-like protein
MQIRKGTQRHLGLKDPFHPYKNIDAGAKYLRELYEKFGSWDLAVAAFNKGPGGLERMLQRNRDPRKLDYVKRVLALSGNIE